MFILFLEGCFIGVFLGLTGAGGGIIAIPTLMYSQHLSIVDAAPIALLAITLSSGFATIHALYSKTVRYKAAIWIALLSMPSVYIGIFLSNWLPMYYVTLIFCVVMLFSGVKTFLNQNTDSDHLSICHTDPITGKFIWTDQTKVHLGFIGIISGLMTGLLGVGGGFIITPALKRMTNLSIVYRSNTSLMIIFLIGMIAFFTHLSSGYHYPKSMTLTFVISCTLGIFFGKQIQKIFSDQIIKKIFSIFIILVSIFMFLKTYQF